METILCIFVTIPLLLVPHLLQGGQHFSIDPKTGDFYVNREWSFSVGEMFTLQLYARVSYAWSVNMHWKVISALFSSGMFLPCMFSQYMLFSLSYPHGLLTLLIVFTFTGSFLTSCRISAALVSKVPSRPSRSASYSDR